jgi:pyruvate decarboxylase
MSSQALQAEVDRLRLELDAANIDASEQISVGNYLLARLAQLGVKCMFGVPGDFNLSFLDLVEDHESIDWVGNCNELNAAYAADGYARVKEHSLGVVLTTFGVGELSAMNGIAGAFSEMVPVLHIAGVPSTAQQKCKLLLHHTLGDGRYDAYIKAAENFTISQAILQHKINAGAEIDRILSDCITSARPVYLALPTNMVHEKIGSRALKTPLRRHSPVNDPDVEKFVLDEIVKLVEQAASNVIILVDACAIRHDVRTEVDELVKQTGFPVYSAPMGKTAVSESHERYGGIYLGSITRPDIKDKVESAHLILSIGSLKSDFNTGNFTYNIPTASTVELHSDHTNIQYANFPAIGMKELLPKLTVRLQPHQEGARQLQVPRFISQVPKEESDVISHTWFWPRLGQFFRPRDVIVTETGTSNFGILDIPLPNESTLVSQILWGSIGWSVGSCLGASLAARERGLGRTILFVGDGSIQLGVQELSVMMTSGVKPIIFLLNNSGYTIERYLHGKNRHYNDISNWKWTSLLKTLGAENMKSKSYTVRNKQELSSLLDDKSFASADVIQLVEVVMDKYDAPRALQIEAQLSNGGG